MLNRNIKAEDLICEAYGHKIFVRQVTHYLQLFTPLFLRSQVAHKWLDIKDFT